MNPNTQQTEKNLIHCRGKEFLDKEGSNEDDSQFNTGIYISEQLKQFLF